jgi:hypothetical protein
MHCIKLSEDKPAPFYISRNGESITAGVVREGILITCWDNTFQDGAGMTLDRTDITELISWLKDTVTALDN